MKGLLTCVFCLACSVAQSASFEQIEMHREAQRIRSRSGLFVQVNDESLNSIAQRWAEQMARSGSMYHGGGEQIIAYSSYPSVGTAFNLWMNSSPHRAWVMSTSGRAGWGYAVGANGGYFAGVFRSAIIQRSTVKECPGGACPVPTEAKKPAGESPPPATVVVVPQEQHSVLKSVTTTKSVTTVGNRWTPIRNLVNRLRR